MTISSQVRKAGPFTGNDATTIFAFAFKVFSTSDVLVTTAIITTGAETVLTLTSDYTVTLNGDQDAAPGGTITLLVALPSTKTMVLTSKVDYLQAVQLTNAGGFYPSVINAALDRLTILAQQLQEKLTRAVTVPVTSTVQPDVLVASVLTSANQASIDAAAAADALANINASTILVNKTSATGSAKIPARTTTQRDVDTPELGLFGYNKTTNSFDGYGAAGWGEIGGGAKGGGTNKVFYMNDHLITDSWTLGQETLISGATITIATPAVCTLTAHGFIAGQMVFFQTTGALPTGLSVDTGYYIISTGLTADAFQLSLTDGGAAIDTSGTQSGVHSCGKIKNAGTFGDVSVAAGVTITAPTGSTWSIN